jgi:hypothetical protein
VQAQIEAPQLWYFESVRGGTAPKSPWLLMEEFPLLAGAAL